MLTVDQAERAIEFFNRETPYPAGDAVIARAFSVEPNAHSHVVRVALLDSLFLTNLGRSKPRGGGRRKSIVEISENIRVSLKRTEEQLQELDSDDLFALNLEREHIRNTIHRVVEGVIGCCNNRSISFATKYLHFFRPTLFAPWDSIVPKEAERLVPELRHESRGKAEIDRYVVFLGAHQTIWSAFDQKEQQILLRFDFQTQPEQWRQFNTSVRVLDKILWAMGKNADG